MLTRRTLLATLALLPTVKFAYPSNSDAWPQRPVRIIMPYPGGSVADVSARLLAQRMSAVFGQPFIVEEKPGANGALAAEFVARSPADAYTLFWAETPQIAIVPAMRKAPYDPVKDFAPISAVNTNGFALVVNPQLPVRTVAELIAYVRAQPHKLTYASGGVGSVSHLSMVLFLHRASLEMTNVPYKGNAPALTDVVAGHLPMMFSVLGDALPYAAAGSVRILAVSSAKRSMRLPKVPTIAESGFPGFNTDAWHGLVAPAATPKATIDRIAVEVARATKDPTFIERLASFGVEPIGNSPDEFAAMISADIKLWAKAVQIAGIKQQ